MLAVVMVTSTSTAAYNNFSDVAETDGMVGLTTTTTTFSFFSLNPNIPANTKSQQQISLFI